MTTTPTPPSDDLWSRVLRAVRATHPGPPARCLADEIAACDTRAATEPAYARRAAELRDIANDTVSTGLWALAVELEDPNRPAYTPPSFPSGGARYRRRRSHNVTKGFVHVEFTDEDDDQESATHRHWRPTTTAP